MVSVREREGEKEAPASIGAAATASNRQCRNMIVPLVPLCRMLTKHEIISSKLYFRYQLMRAAMFNLLTSLF